MVFLSKSKAELGTGGVKQFGTAPPVTCLGKGPFGHVSAAKGGFQLSDSPQPPAAPKVFLQSSVEAVLGLIKICLSTGGVWGPGGGWWGGDVAWSPRS